MTKPMSDPMISKINSFIIYQLKMDPIMLLLNLAHTKNDDNRTIRLHVSP